MKVLVTGTHGLIGSAVVTALEQQGHEVVALVRGPAGPGQLSWEPEAGRLAGAALAGLDGAVHLAGAPIAEKRWTAEQKERIRSSRVDTTDLLARTLAECPSPPSVLVSGSAIGYYGDRGDTVLDEDSGPGTDFLSEVCQRWEAATAPAEAAGIRVVHIRTGIVLSAAGGVVKKLLPLFRLGMGGRLGSGAFYQSWISRHDEVAAIIYALETASLTGAANLTAPNPVTNAEFTETLGKVLHRPTRLTAPQFALTTALGREMVEAMLLASQLVLPTKLLAHGFSFRHPDLDDALRAALTEAP